MEYTDKKQANDKKINQRKNDSFETENLGRSILLGETRSSEAWAFIRICLQ